MEWFRKPGREWSEEDRQAALQAIDAAEGPRLFFVKTIKDADRSCLAQDAALSALRGHVDALERIYESQGSLPEQVPVVRTLAQGVWGSRKRFNRLLELLGNDPDDLIVATLDEARRQMMEIHRAVADIERVRRFWSRVVGEYKGNETKDAFTPYFAIRAEAQWILEFLPPVFREGALKEFLCRNEDVLEAFKKHPRVHRRQAKLERDGVLPETALDGAVKEVVSYFWDEGRALSIVRNYDPDQGLAWQYIWGCAERTRREEELEELPDDIGAPIVTRAMSVDRDLVKVREEFIEHLRTGRAERWRRAVGLYYGILDPEGGEAPHGPLPISSQELVLSGLPATMLVGGVALAKAILRTPDRRRRPRTGYGPNRRGARRTRPEEDRSADVEWTTSDASVARIMSEEGQHQVLGCREGTAEITVTMGSLRCSERIRVSRSALVLHGLPASIPVDECVRVQVLLETDHDGPADVTGEAVWTSTDNDVAAVIENRDTHQFEVTAFQNPGVARITASYAGLECTRTVFVLKSRREWIKLIFNIWDNHAGVLLCEGLHNLAALYRADRPRR